MCSDVLKQNEDSSAINTEYVKFAEELRSMALFPEQNPSPVLRVGSDGRLLYSNRGAAPILEYWKTEPGGFVPDSVKVAIKQAMKSGEVQQLEIGLPDCFFSFDIVPVSEYRYLNLYGRDVTDRQEAQKRERQASAAASASRTALDALNAMGEGVALLETDGTIREVNPAFTLLTDCEEEDIRGKNIMSMLSEIFDEERKTVEKAFVRVRLKENKTDPGDALAVTTGGGDRKWLIPTLSTLHGDNDEPVGVVLTLRDVTALVEAREELRIREHEYRTLIQGANSIIMRITPERRIDFLNEYAQKFFGYAPEEIRGRDLLGTIIPEIDSAGRDMREMIDRVFSDSEQFDYIEHENICKDGRRVWISWSNCAVRDKRGRIREILCIGTDSTERKKLEEESEHYRRKLKELADRLAATEEKERRRIATHIHDTVIQMLSLSNIRLGGVKEAVEEAGLAEQGDRLDGIRQLIDDGIRECRQLMGELIPPLLYELGLAAAIRDFAEKQSVSENTPITVEKEGETEPMDDALRGLLFQSSRELIMNALKYAGPCEIHVNISRDGDVVVLKVRDTGRGFEAKDVAETGHGGFGLFNIRERLEGLGGSLEIKSVSGKGTEAVIRVPAAGTH